MIVEIDGMRRNLLWFTSGPYTWDPATKSMRNLKGENCNGLGMHGMSAEAGAAVAERWNTYYAMYLMLK